MKELHRAPVPALGSMPSASPCVHEPGRSPNPVLVFYLFIFWVALFHGHA